MQRRKIKTFHVQALRRSVWILLNLHTVAHVSVWTWQKPAICLSQQQEFQILHPVIKWSQIACGIVCSTVLLRLGVRSFLAERYPQPACRWRRGAYMMEPPPRLYMTTRCCLTGRYVVMCLLNWLNKHYAPACQPCCSSFSSLCVLCLLPAAVILSSAASFNPVYFNYFEQTQTRGLRSTGEVCPPPFC